MAHFDVVVCGLGAMGSAAVEHWRAEESGYWGWSVTPLVKRHDIARFSLGRFG
jgi:hypothetical protein